MNQAVIVDSLRTGLAKSYRGGFNQTRADDMTAHLINTLLEKHPQLEPDMVEDVILGCGYPEGSQGSNVARTSAVLSNLPVSVGGTTVNRFCSSGLQTVAMAATQIQSGYADCIMAGGVESISTTQPNNINMFMFENETPHSNQYRRECCIKFTVSFRLLHEVPIRIFSLKFSFDKALIKAFFSAIEINCPQPVLPKNAEPTPLSSRFFFA